jgi:transcriptional regulator with XRE-family HTH domain
MDSEKKLAKILKAARKTAKLTQAQVAVKAEIHTNYYARIERGEVNPTSDILNSLAKALKIELKFPLK